MLGSDPHHKSEDCGEGGRRKGDYKARLTQEPYYFPDIHTGFESWYTVDDLTDWIIYKEDMTITPDNVYLLDKKKK